MTQGKTAYYNGGYVGPGDASALTLNKGVYSLSSRSNVPYVELRGAGGYQKIISWGEIAEVDCANVVIWNASAHAGNIIINMGAEPYPLPSRITVPVRIQQADGEFGVSRVGYVDTRRARRGYLAVDLPPQEDPTTLTVCGYADLSHNTVNMLTGGFVEPGLGYTQTHLINANVQFPLIPLGFKAVLGDDSRPHVLLSRAYVNLGLGVISPEPTAYYILEY